MLKKSALIIFLVLLLDQILKIWIKTHMYLGQEIHVIGNWFILHFTENNGMAFGMEFAGNYGKLFLSVFRIIAVAAIGWYIFKLAKKKDVSFGLIFCISLIFTGAVGNIIDSAFYGIVFNCSECTDPHEGYISYQVAQFLPHGGGYASFLHGKVVDMLYFPIIQGHFPHWLPFWGGDDFEFFRPVFNLSDSSITVGVILLILFQRRFFHKPIAEESSKDTDIATSDLKPEENI